MRISVVFENIGLSRTCVTLLAYSARRIKPQVGPTRGDGRKEGLSSAGLGAAKLKATMKERRRERVSIGITFAAWEGDRLGREVWRD